MNSFTEIRVVSAIADKNKVVFYKEDGSTVIVKQGDHRLLTLLDEIIPITSRGEVAVVSLEKYSVYADFEQQTGGFMKMFKVAKKAVSRFFGIGNTEEITIMNTEVTQGETLPTTPSPEPALVPEGEKPVAPQPVSPPKETTHSIHVDVRTADMQVQRVKMDVQKMGVDEDLNANESVIGIIGNTIIPNVDALYPLIRRAMRNQNTVALENFIKRVAEISKHRMHSVVDLMRFIERSDLPLTDSGDIIAYKMVNLHEGKSSTNPLDWVFVDCHTRKIKQRIGSRVELADGLVDLDRRNECSNGLHIARRAYLRAFGGDKCLITLIAPEDVMVVPHNDANKVRVRGYDILGVLNADAMEAVKSDRPFNENSAAMSLVHQIMKGKHIAIYEKVIVGGQGGTNLSVIPISAAPVHLADYVVSDTALNEARPIEEEEEAPLVDPRDLNKKINENIITNRELERHVDDLPDEPDEDEDEGVEEEFEDDDIPDEHIAEEREAILPPPSFHEADAEELEAVVEMHDEIVDRLAAKPVLEPKKEGEKSPRQILLSNFQVAPIGSVARLRAAEEILTYKRAIRKSWVSVVPDDAMLKDILFLTNAGPKKTEPKKVKAAKPKPAPKKKASPKKPVKKSAVTINMPVPPTDKSEMQKMALDMFNRSKTKAEIYDATGISPRSLGRLLDKATKGD